MFCLFITNPFNLVKSNLFLSLHQLKKHSKSPTVFWTPIVASHDKFFIIAL